MHMYMYMYHIRTKYLRRGRTLGRGWEDIGRKLGGQLWLMSFPWRLHNWNRTVRSCRTASPSLMVLVVLIVVMLGIIVMENTRWYG